MPSHTSLETRDLGIHGTLTAEVETTVECVQLRGHAWFAGHRRVLSVWIERDGRRWVFDLQATEDAPPAR